MKKIKTPLTDTVIADLKSGDEVLLSGTIYTARDQAHKRLCELAAAGKKLPIDFTGQVIYYTGPTPALPGTVIGSCGPTTSGRMDPFTIPLLKTGLKGMIGKGERSVEICQALQTYKSVYFVAIGGLGALLSSFVVSARVVSFEDLGTEAIRELTVKDFPIFVGNDMYGTSIFHRSAP